MFLYCITARAWIVSSPLSPRSSSRFTFSRFSGFWRQFQCFPFSIQLQVKQTNKIFTKCKEITHYRCHPATDPETRGAKSAHLNKVWATTLASDYESPGWSLRTWVAKSDRGSLRMRLFVCTSEISSQGQVLDPRGSYLRPSALYCLCRKSAAHDKVQQAIW